MATEEFENLDSGWEGPAPGWFAGEQGPAYSRRIFSHNNHGHLYRPPSRMDASPTFFFSLLPFSMESPPTHPLPPRRSLTTPSPMLPRSVGARSSTPNLALVRVGYHKPTSVWVRSSTMSETMSETSSELGTPISFLNTSYFETSPSPSHESPDTTTTTPSLHRSASPVSATDVRRPPGLRSMASCPSLRVSPSSISTSISTPPTSPCCSNVNVCVNHADLEDQPHLHNYPPPARVHNLSNPYPTKLRNSRTFVAPGVDLTFQELADAQNHILYDQESQAVRFGDLFRDQKTVVIFIRHFLCPFCADYMRAIVRQVKPRALATSNVKLLVVSHGSPRMIKSYRSIFNLPYPVYTDPSRKIYRALNMTLRTLSGGPKSERGDYLEHNLTLGLARVAKNAVKAGMPLHRYPGDFFQVGGEFVLGPGLQCSYVSRMYNTASHAPIREVIRAAGVNLDIGPNGGDANHWIKAREEELERIRERKGRRRRGHSSATNQSDATKSRTNSDTQESVDITHIRELLDATRQLSL